MSDLLARLIAAGTPAHLVAEVAMLAARAEVDKEAIEARRTKDRERQAARRNVTSRDTADVADETPAPSPSSSPDPSNNPTPTPVESPRARKGSASTGHRLPVDWQPEALTGDIGAAVAKWPPGACDRELARFRDWAAGATGPNAKKSDWQATFRNWLRRADDEGKYRNEPVRSHRGQPTRPGDGFGAALREMSGSSPPHH